MFQGFNLLPRTTALDNVELPMLYDRSGRERDTRALVTSPLILADEPTGNLDTRTSTEVMALFQELNEQGITIIVVTHERDIAAYAKRIVEVRDGR